MLRLNSIPVFVAGQFHRGFRCEDIEAQTFGNQTFDKS